MQEDKEQITVNPARPKGAKIENGKEENQEMKTKDERTFHSLIVFSFPDFSILGTAAAVNVSVF